ncbi:MAG: acetate kinase [Anaerolineales bacterium]|nr:acetate kinase [Anaerolineales bacterium]MCB9127613.1 acetate kinase [Ardenticatenales bacterium]
MIILVLNCGSSSIKFQLRDLSREAPLATGLVSEIGSPRAHFQWESRAGRWDDAAPDLSYREGLQRLLAAISSGEQRVIPSLAALDAVGHRVVHGGERFSDATLISDEVIAAIEAVSDLAPLHNPANLLGIEVCRELLPNTPQVAVFDTAFHQTLPAHAYLYALPYELYERHGVRRYGFHGTSHRYVTERAAALLGRTGRFISLHLGNGCSIAAVREGRSVDTSMGLTPLEGLVMGTRSGDIDPALVTFIAAKEGISASEVERLLNKQSGLLGLSQSTSDMRLLLEGAAAGDGACQRAVDLFCYRARKYIGAYAAAMGGVDALIFTGGIGENAPPIRATIVQGLEFLGISLDETANRDGKVRGQIHGPAATVPVLVIPTNEEGVIAEDTRRIVERC